MRNGHRQGVFAVLDFLPRRLLACIIHEARLNNADQALPTYEMLSNSCKVVKAKLVTIKVINI